MTTKILYHGTNGQHASSFLHNGILPSSTGRLGPGTYFAEDKAVAQKVANNHKGAGCPLVLTYLVDVSGKVLSGTHPPWAGNPAFTEYCITDQTRILKLVGIEGKLDHTVPARYIRNVGHPCFLDSHGKKVWVWGDGVTVGEDDVNLQWMFVPVAGEPETFYIVHKRFNAFLDSHGDDVKLWGDGKDIGQVPDNIKWRRKAVPRAPNTYYLIHKATNKFLDTHGVRRGSDTGAVKLWGDGVNTGEYPRNLQWQLAQA